MSRRVLVDTGPLVALLNRRDRHHEWVRECFGEIAPPLLTCEAVMAEVCFLTQRGGGSADEVLDLVDRGVVNLTFRLAEQLEGVQRLLKRHADQGVSLADACLVRMSELHADAVLLTLDSDFRVYRRLGRQAIPVWMP